MDRHRALSPTQNGSAYQKAASSGGRARCLRGPMPPTVSIGRHPPLWSAGYTAPLVQWVETKIEGLVDRPVVLRSAYAQTYRPLHHNFTEDFLFEPRLEPTLAPDVLQALETQKIRYIYLQAGHPNNRLRVIDKDGQLREVP